MKKIILALMLAFGVGMAEQATDCLKASDFAQKCAQICDKDDTGNACQRIGYVYYAEKKYQQAEFYFDKACKKNKNYCYYVAQNYYQWGNDYDDFKKAEIYYKKAEDDGGDYAAKGDEAFLAKDYKQAEIYYKKACERDKIYCAKIDFVKGDKAFSAGDYKQAEIYFKRACENDDKLYAYPICRSITHKYFEIKDYEKAYFYDTFHRQKACEKDSYSYECVGIPRESIDYYLSGTFDRKCKRDFGEEYCSYYKKGAEYLTKKDYKWAKIWFDKACWFGNDDRDSNPPFCLAIGIKYLAIDDYKQAENYFRGVCPASAYCLHEVALQARAEYYLKKQDYEKAAQCFAGACNSSLSNNNDKWAYSSYLTIGYAFFSRKYFKQADIYYKKANDILAKLCKNSDDKKQCAQDLFDDGEEY